MDIKKQLIPVNRKDQRPGLALKVKSITIHSTGNPTSTAQNEADNVCYNSTRKASFHYVVDDKEIIQVIPDNERAYHAGEQANRESLGIEICESGNRKKALLNAAWLIRHLSEKYKLTKFKTHKDWTGKICPRILIDKAYIKDGLNLDAFMRMINNPEESEETELIYNKMEEIPAWAHGPVKWAIDNGILKGDAKGLALTSDNLKTIIFLHRYAQLEK